MPIRIVTDSSCDLPAEITDRDDINVVPLYVNIGEKSYLDGIELSRADFYEGLPDFKNHPTTSAPGLGTFADLYDRLAAEGATEILSIHISATLSNTVNVARLAAEATKSVPVTVFDTGNLTLGVGLMVLDAAEAAAAGRPMDEILAMLADKSRRTYSFAALDTLEYLRRSGRLSRFQSSLGAVLQIKPLLTMHDGEMSLERVRTRRRAMERVIELSREVGPLEQLAVVHTHEPKRANDLRQQAIDLIPEDNRYLSAEVTPVIGTHVGPGAVGLVAVASRAPKHQT
ncbi:MAG: DegV family protein [Anaerolineae bacterium]|jgi:DegV family protein with EDD domain